MIKASTFTATVFSARKRKGLTQVQVADKMGMKRATYSKKENDGGFSEEQLRHLSQILQLSYAVLTKKVKEKFMLEDCVVRIEGKIDDVLTLVRNHALTNMPLT